VANLTLGGAKMLTKYKVSDVQEGFVEEVSIFCCGCGKELLKNHKMWFDADEDPAAIFCTQQCAKTPNYSFVNEQALRFALQSCKFLGFSQ